MKNLRRNLEERSLSSPFDDKLVFLRHFDRVIEWRNLAFSSLVFLLSLVFLISSSQVSASVPQVISYQGLLTASGGVPASGNHDFRIKFYSSSTGGTNFYEEQFNAISVNSGIFGINLGQGSVISGSFGSIDFNNPVFITLNVKASVSGSFDGEMNPRILLRSVPYSLNSKQVDGRTVGGPNGIVAYDNAQNITANGATFGGIITAGTGLTPITTVTGTINANALTLSDASLKVTGTALSVNNAPTGGIITTSNGLALAINPTGGLVSTASGLGLSNTCATNESLKWDGTNWICAVYTDSQTLSFNNTTRDLTILGGNIVNIPQILYTAGTGISLTGTEFSNSGLIGLATGFGITNTGTAQNPLLSNTLSLANIPGVLAPISIAPSTSDGYVLTTQAGATTWAPIPATINNLIFSSVTSDITSVVNGASSSTNLSSLLSGSTLQAVTNNGNTTTNTIIVQDLLGRRTVQGNGSFTFASTFNNNSTALTFGAPAGTSNTVALPGIVSGTLALSVNGITADSTGDIDINPLLVNVGNFATADLTATGNRFHSFNNFGLSIGAVTDFEVLSSNSGKLSAGGFGSGAQIDYGNGAISLLTGNLVQGANNTITIGTPGLELNSENNLFGYNSTLSLLNGDLKYRNNLTGFEIINAKPTGDIAFGTYPNTRDDIITSGGLLAPVNFLYTGNAGEVLSAPLSAITAGLNTNFANTNLTATGGRLHNFTGFDLAINNINNYDITATNSTQTFANNLNLSSDVVNIFGSSFIQLIAPQGINAVSNLGNLEFTATNGSNIFTSGGQNRFKATTGNNTFEGSTFLSTSSTAFGASSVFISSGSEQQQVIELKQAGQNNRYGLFIGTPNPQGVYTADLGSIYLNNTGSTGGAYLKTFGGTTNTGWDKILTASNLVSLSSPITIQNSTSLFATGLPSPAGVGATGATNSVFLGSNAGLGASSAFSSNFFGFDAGNSATQAFNSNFFGASAGFNAANAGGSNFFGPNAGFGATNAGSSNFFGSNVGNGAINATNSNFFGNVAGLGAINASDSNFFGRFAGNNASEASNSNFFGFNAGANAVTANNSIFIGNSAGSDDVVNNGFAGLSSILIGDNTKTGGFSNSIVLGAGGVNTATNQFKVAPSYTGLSLGGIDYTVPTAQGGTGSVLSNDGSGLLSWTLPSGGSNNLQYYRESSVAPATTNALPGNESVAIGSGNILNSSDSFILGKNNSGTSFSASNVYVGNNNSNTSGQDVAIIGANNAVGSGFRTLVAGYNNQVTSSGDSGIFGNDNQLQIFGSYIFGSNILNTTAGSIDIGTSNTTKLTVAGDGTLTLRGALNTNTVTGNVGDVLVSRGALLSPVWQAPGGGGSVSASNGLTMIAADVTLGGNLTQNTLINGNSGLFDLSLQDLNNFGISGNAIDLTANIITLTNAPANTRVATKFLTRNVTTGVVEQIDTSFFASPITVQNFNTLLSSGTGFIPTTGASNSVFLGFAAGHNADSSNFSNFIGAYAGYGNQFNSGTATSATNSNFFGSFAGYGAANANNSIFIGNSTGFDDTVSNFGTGIFAPASILIGNFANTGGFSDSIVLGNQGTNTSSNQLLIPANYNKLSIGGVEYVVPNSQGAAGQVLINDGTGVLSWGVQPTIFATPPITIQNTNSLFATGLPNPAGVGATSATDSIFLGSSAGRDAINASNSNFFGTNAGNGATNAGASNFFGFEAGYLANGAGFSNFFGSSAGNQSTLANYSNFFGVGAGALSPNANNSNFFGFEAGLQANNASTSNFFGNSAGKQAANAPNSNFIGNGAGQAATNASRSNFIGLSAGSRALNANNSIFIGSNAGFQDAVNNSAGESSILIGDNTNTGGFGNSLVLGPNAINTKTNQFLVSPTYTDFNFRGVNYIFPSTQATVPGQVLTNNGLGQLSWVTPASSTAFINGGNSFGGLTTLGTNDTNPLNFEVNNTTLLTLTPKGRLVLSNTQNNSFAGVNSGNETTTGTKNVALGFETLFFNGTGSENIAIGANALRQNSTGFGNIALGTTALQVTNSALNVAVGYQAMTSNSSGANNTGVGYQALTSNISGGSNVAFGDRALQTLTSGDFNTGIGPFALQGFTSGTRNIAIGQFAGGSLITGSDNIAIGQGTTIPNNSTGRLNLGNIIFGTGLGNYNFSSLNGPGFIGIGTSTPGNKLEIDATPGGGSGLRFTRLTSASTIATGQPLGVDASGNVVTIAGTTGITSYCAGAQISGGAPATGINSFGAACSGGNDVGIANQLSIGTRSFSGLNIITDNTTRISVGDVGGVSINTNLSVTNNSGAVAVFTGVSEALRITSSGNTGFKNPSPLYSVDAVNTGGQIRFGNASSDAGGFLWSNGNNNSVSAAGYVWNGSQFIAKGTIATSLIQNAGSLAFTSDISSAGTAFTPTTRFSVSNSGLISGNGIISNNNVQITSNVPNTSGLRLVNLTASSPTTTGQAIGVDSSGNIVTVANAISSSAITVENTSSLFSTGQPNPAGVGATNATDSIFFGTTAGENAVNAFRSTFLGFLTGASATNANNSIFIGESAGENATNANKSIFIGNSAGITDSVNNLTGGSSILIGDFSGTGGFSNSIGLGAGAINTSANQLMIGSTSSPINTTVIRGAGATQCTIVTGTGITCSSDSRLKKNIVSLSASSTLINQLRPVTYNWKEGIADTQTGFIAQEVEIVIPGLVSTNSDGFKSLNTTGILPYLVKAFQEQQTEIDAIKVRLGLSTAVLSQTDSPLSLQNQTQIVGILDRLGLIENTNTRQDTELQTLRNQNQALEQRLKALEDLLLQPQPIIP